MIYCYSPDQKYLYEVLGCEAYSRDSLKRGQGSLTELFKNDEESKEGLRRLAAWSFDKRFIEVTVFLCLSLKAAVHALVPQ